MYIHVRRISQENMKLVRVCVFFKFVRVDTVCRVIYAVLFSSFVILHLQSVWPRLEFAQKKFCLKRDNSRQWN